MTKRDLRQHWDRGNRAAYVRAIREFNGASLPEKNIEQESIQSAYEAGVMDAYQKTLAAINGGKTDARVSLTDDSIAAQYAAMGEEEAYRKAIAKFKGISPTVNGGFFKNTPTSLYAAKKMMSPGKVKGQFIRQNWNTVRDSLERAISAGPDFTWRAFRGLASQLALFVEEFENDLSDNTLTKVDDFLTQIWRDWPHYVEITGGQRIRYEANSDLGNSSIRPLTVAMGVSNYQIVRANEKNPKSEPKRGDKMEILRDAYMTFPDNRSAFIYAFAWGDQDSKNAAYSKEVIDRILNESVYSPLSAIYQLIVNPKVEDQIYERQALYDAIVDLRKALDNLRDIINPSSNKPVEPEDMERILGVRTLIEDLMENVDGGDEIHDLLGEMLVNITPEKWFYAHGVGPIGKIGTNIMNVWRKLDGDYEKEEREIVAGLRKIDHAYDQLWAMIHTGKKVPEVRL